MSELEEKIPLSEHLTELRTRLIRSFIAVTLCFCVTYFFKEELFNILLNPLIKVMDKGGSLIYTNLPEAFFSYLKVAFLFALMLSSPYVLFEFWGFVAPGLYKKEKTYLFFIAIFSAVFFVGGALFGYFIVFPFGFKFFLAFGSETLKAMPSMKEYFAFSSKLLIAFGVIFELPLVITFMARLGIVSVEFLKKHRKYAILIFFIGAAILTPPDVITQIMMAFPLMLLYEISILGAKVFGKKKDKEEEDS